MNEFFQLSLGYALVILDSIFAGWRHTYQFPFTVFRKTFDQEGEPWIVMNWNGINLLHRRHEHWLMGFTVNTYWRCLGISNQMASIKNSSAPLRLPSNLQFCANARYRIASIQWCTAMLYVLKLSTESMIDLDAAVLLLSAGQSQRTDANHLQEIEYQNDLNCRCRWRFCPPITRLLNRG